MTSLAAPTHAYTQPDVFESAEVTRITKLRIMTPMEPHELEEFSRLHVQAAHFDTGFRLFPEQAEGLFTYEMFGACFARIPVGRGKSLLGLMCASAAFSKGLQRMLLMVPPEVFSQLVDTDIPWARSRVEINYPIHILGNRPMEYRRSLCASKRKGLYIMPHSLVSTKDTDENLANIDPQLIIIDEAHRFANASAARTRRLTRLLDDAQQKGKKTELVIMSGTITGKSVKDYYHLIKPCLREGCPLPLSGMMMNDWAVLIDAEASKEETPRPSVASTAAILPLVCWAKKNFPNAAGGFPPNVFGFRSAYKHRLNTTPGVVTSSDTEIGTSLIMSNRPVLEFETSLGWPLLKKLMDQVTEMWLTPNGDEIDHAIHTWKWLNELSGAGFYNELTWPEAEVLAERKKISLDEAADRIFKAIIHHGAGQGYTKLLRDFLLNRSKPGIDTPFLVGQEMMRNGPKNVDGDMYTAWREWKDLDFPERPERDSRAVRVCPYKIDAAVAWAKETAQEKKTGGIIWVFHQEAGVWQMEELSKAGIDALHCPAGQNEAIRDPINRNKICVASYTAHGTGKNLQHFQEQYFLQWPRSAKTAEQTIGRTHRSGQMADELTVVTNQTTYFDQLNFAACLNDALYIHQTDNRQKLIYASYSEPRPKIFPYSVLYQQGLDVQKLDRQAQELFTEKFGKY